jgi:hypothetical protein
LRVSLRKGTGARERVSAWARGKTAHRADAHLDRVLVVRDLERLGGEDPAAPEALGLEARGASLKGRVRLGAGDLVRDLLLGRERHAVRRRERVSVAASPTQARRFEGAEAH